MARISELESEAAVAAGRIETLETDAAELKVNLEASEARVASLTTELEGTKTALADSRTREATLTEELGSETARASLLLEQREELATRLDEAHERIAEVQGQKAALAERSHAAGVQVVALASTLSATEDELYEEGRRLGAAHERLSEVQAQKAQLATRANVAGAQLVTLTSTLQTTRYELAASQTRASDFLARSLLSLVSYAVRRDWTVLRAAVCAELNHTSVIEKTTRFGRLGARCARACALVWAYSARVLAALVAVCLRAVGRPPKAPEQAAGGNGVTNGVDIWAQSAGGLVVPTRGIGEVGWKQQLLEKLNARRE